MVSGSVVDVGVRLVVAATGALVVGAASVVVVSEVALSPHATVSSASAVNRIGHRGTRSLGDRIMGLLSGSGSRRYTDGISFSDLDPHLATWTVTGLRGDSGVVAPVLADTALTITFDEEVVRGSSGCNTYFGPFRIGDGHEVDIGPIAGTLMFCATPEGVMEQERRFLDLLSSADSISVGEDRLEIGAGGTVAIVATPTSDVLIGSWSLLFHDNGTAMVSLVPGSEVTAEFAEDGVLHGGGGCNRYHAGYRVEGASLSISAPAVTRMMCPEPEVMEQELVYLRLLSRVASHRLREGGLLELYDDEGARLLQFTRR